MAAPDCTQAVHHCLALVFPFQGLRISSCYTYGIMSIYLQYMYVNTIPEPFHTTYMYIYQGFSKALYGYSYYHFITPYSHVSLNQEECAASSHTVLGQKSKSQKAVPNKYHQNPIFLKNPTLIK